MTHAHSCSPSGSVWSTVPTLRLIWSFERHGFLQRHRVQKSPFYAALGVLMQQTSQSLNEAFHRMSYTWEFALLFCIPPVGKFSGMKLLWYG